MREFNSTMNIRRSRGLSLIELMVSILLGVILSSGIIAVYLESKRNYAAEEEMARIQENGRFALELLKRELSMAGFFGGYFVAEDSMNGESLTGGGEECVATGEWALDVTTPLEVINNFNNSWVTNTPTTLAGCVPTNSWVKAGSDVLTVKRTSAKPTMFEGLLVDGAKARDSQYYLKVEQYGDTKEWFYDPSVADDFAADPNDVEEYWEMYAKIFYIRNWSVAVGDGVPALCVRELIQNEMATTDRCLVEGIEDMQIEFGVDSNADDVPNTYTPDPNDMNQVVTARIYLLVRSLGELVSTENANTKTYQLGLDSGVVTTANDGYMRQMFSTTVLVRNAILPAS
ncbi:MAG: PilW family protein [Halioglobus sp.]